MGEAEKSELVSTLDEIQSGLKSVLKEHGFRARGRTFNRTNADGLVEVIHLQAGRFDPPGTHEIPGLRPDLYGMFTVELGIFVPEVGRLLDDRQPPAFVQAGDCCMRGRLAKLAGEEQDRWWPIERGQTLLADLRTRIERDGFAFFERFGSRERILARLTDEERELAARPPRIIRALLHFERGERAAARALLEQQRETGGHPSHAEYVRHLIAKLGLG